MHERRGRTDQTSASSWHGQRVSEKNHLNFNTFQGTRKPKTETFVVRSKKREDVIKRAVDIGGVQMIIAEKAVKQEEEKVEVIKAPIKVNSK